MATNLNRMTIGMTRICMHVLTNGVAYILMDTILLQAAGMLKKMKKMEGESHVSMKDEDIPNVKTTRKLLKY